MKRIIIIVFATMASAYPFYAQDKNTLAQRINEIKKQTEVYYWDQYTHPDADSAKINATKRLLLHVDNRNEDGELSVEKIMPYASYINIDRGNLKQYFVYIKKTDAASIGSIPQPIVGIPVNRNSPIVAPSAQKPFVPDAFVQRIMETKNFMDVYSLLKSLQSQGQVLQFGRLKDVEDYSSLDLILFDMQSQEIITMLSPETASGNRTNVINGSEDSLNNYPTNMTAVIWYIKK